MRTVRLVLAGMVMLALLSGLSGGIVAQDEPTGPAEVGSETLFELTIPSSALPDRFTKLIVEDLKLAADTDGSDHDRRTTQANESMRGRAFLVESGEFLFEPTTDALLWREAGTEPQVAPADQAVTVLPGEAIFLPAVPDSEVDADAYLRVANRGSEDATARSFHTHQVGAPFGGFPLGATVGDWKESGGDPLTMVPFDGVDVLFRLTRRSGGPGVALPLADPPAVAIYYVESGVLELTTRGPHGELTEQWPAREDLDFFLPLFEGVEQSLVVVGGDAATVLELVAIPISG